MKKQSKASDAAARTMNYTNQLENKYKNSKKGRQSVKTKVIVAPKATPRYKSHLKIKNTFQPRIGIDKQAKLKEVVATHTFFKKIRRECRRRSFKTRIRIKKQSNHIEVIVPTQYSAKHMQKTNSLLPNASQKFEAISKKSLS